MASKPFASGHLLAAADVNDLVSVYERSTSQVDVVSSAVFTALYSKAIGAGHMSSDRMIRCTLLGDYLNNTGTGQGFEIDIEFGGTILFLDSITIGTAAGRRPLSLVIEVANLATNSQVMTARLGIGSAVAPTNGLGQIDALSLATGLTTVNGDVQALAVASGTAAVDTTAAATFAVFIKHAASNANLSCRKKYAMLELL